MPQPLPLPNLTDLKCAIKASIASTVGGAVTGALIAATISHFYPAVAAVMTLIRLGAGGGAVVALPVSMTATYGQCQEDSNAAYTRNVALQQEISYCKTIEEGKLIVSTLPWGRPVKMSQAYYLNQIADQHRINYEDCIKKGHIAPDQLQLPSPALPALPPAAGTS